jgi:hypothetical protein
MTFLRNPEIDMFNSSRNRPPKSERQESRLAQHVIEGRQAEAVAEAKRILARQDALRAERAKQFGR